MPLLQQVQLAAFFFRLQAQYIQPLHDSALVARLEMTQIQLKAPAMQMFVQILREAVRGVMPRQVGKGLVVIGKAAFADQPTQALPLLR